MSTFFKSEIKNEPLKEVGTIAALGKKNRVFCRGNGKIPLLVLGAASLFKKPGFIPSCFDKYCTLYFVDLFEMNMEVSINYSSLQMNDFVQAVESIRVQLHLEKVGLFSHSGPGVLGIEYSEKYSVRVLFNIIVATAPIWGSYKDELVASHFKDNSSIDRDKMFKEDQKMLPKTPNFVQNYNARRAHFYYQPLEPRWSHIWDGIDLDETLIGKYFSLLKTYDVRKVAIKDTKIFLALGLYDFSNPFFAWADELRDKLKEANMEYYIFEKSGHYPNLEEAGLFSEKAVEFIVKHFPEYFSSTINNDSSHVVDKDAKLDAIR